MVMVTAATSNLNLLLIFFNINNDYTNFIDYIGTIILFIYF